MATCALTSSAWWAPPLSRADNGLTRSVAAYNGDLCFDPSAWWAPPLLWPENAFLPVLFAADNGDLCFDPMRLVGTTTVVAKLLCFDACAPAADSAF